MSPEEMRIAVAEACNRPELAAALADEKTALWAMHEAEKVLTNYQRQKHGQLLQEIMNEAVVGFVEDYARQLAGLSRVASATAAQRAEAFLRAIGKWEGQP